MVTTRVLFRTQMSNTRRNLKYCTSNVKKLYFIALFYGWGSTASRLEPLQRGSLIFTTKLPEIPGTCFIDLGRMNGLADPGPTQWF